MFDRKKNKYSYRNPRIFTSTAKRSREFKIPPFLIKIVIIVVAIVFLFWFLFWSNYFKIKTIEIKGSLNPEVKESIDRFFGKNILTFSTGKIEEDLAKRQSSIRSLEIKRGIPNILKVQVNVRVPEIGWKTNGKIYYIDNEGIIFELSNTNKAQNVPIIEDIKNLPVNLGAPIVTIDFIDFIKDFSSRINNELHIKLNSIKINETTFQIEAATDQGFILMLNTTNDLDNQIKALKVILETKRPDIHEYIDLRVEGRVYYK